MQETSGECSELHLSAGLPTITLLDSIVSNRYLMALTLEPFHFIRSVRIHRCPSS
jgi:hypothetical protein